MQLMARAPLSAMSKLSIGGAGVLGAGYLYRPLGAVLAAVTVLVPRAIALVLLGAIMRGSDQTCERIFRLLRWITNRPEPPPPGSPLIYRHRHADLRRSQAPAIGEEAAEGSQPIMGRE